MQRIQHVKTRSLPDLPPFEPREQLTLREACEQMAVTLVTGGRVRATQLQRWATRGVTIGGQRYRFPSRRGERERYTCVGWCRAWMSFVERELVGQAERELERMGA